MIALFSLMAQLVCILPISQYSSKHEKECHGHECFGGIATALRITESEGEPNQNSVWRGGGLFEADWRPTFYVRPQFPAMLDKELMDTV